MEKHTGIGKNIFILMIIAGILLFLSKLYAWIITDSNAILSDALESIINIAAGTFSFYSFYLSAKPKDKDHPYGHGKIEFLSASIEGTLIFIAGLSIIGKAITDLYAVNEIQNLQIGTLIIFGTGIINGLIGKIAQKHALKINSATLYASGKHLWSDALSTFALCIGLLGVYLSGLFWIDNLLAIAAGLFILYSGYKIIRSSVAGIMDETDDKLLEEMIHTLEEKRDPHWIDIHNLRVIKYGSKLHIDAHITLPWYMDVATSHEEVKKVEDLININFGERAEFFFHTDPCLPTSCSICSITTCKVRQHVFTGSLKWTTENVLINSRHGK